jgi:phospholipid/cholesterol/gamma-HCH transport system substrate-binding protein
MRNHFLNYTAVGVFVCAMIVALVVAITLVTGRTGPSDAYVVMLDNVMDIKYGTVLRYEGFQIGQVDKIEPDYKDGKYRFKVKVGVVSGWKFPVDSVASIAASSFLAAKTLDIRGGQSKDVIPVGGEIKGSGPSDMFALMASLAGQVSSLLENGVSPLITQLQGSLKQLTQTTDTQINAVGTGVQGLIRNANGKLDVITEQVKGVTDDMRDNLAQVRKMLADGNVEAVKRILGNLDRASKNADQTIAELNALATEVNGVAVDVHAMINDNRKNVDKSVSDLEYILRAVAQNIDAITNNLEGSTRNMNEFSRLIRQNPGLLLSGGNPKNDEGLTPSTGKTTTP